MTKKMRFLFLSYPRPFPIIARPSGTETLKVPVVCNLMTLTDDDGSITSWSLSHITLITLMSPSFTLPSPAQPYLPTTTISAFTTLEMASVNAEPQRLLCWTVCAYRKPGMDEGDYHRYMSEIHAPLVRDLMVKYGMIRWSMVRVLALHQVRS